jgi:hypothetical protein
MKEDKQKIINSNKINNEINRKGRNYKWKKNGKERKGKEK